MPRYAQEPSDPRAFSARFDRFYGRFAVAYDVLVRALPIWKRWLRRALPQLDGPRILEVSVGTGWLLTQYAGVAQVWGIDLNARMLAIARRNLQRRGLSVALQQANVEALPYRDAAFDTVLNTMAFSGYPDAHRALAEMLRVLKPHGRLVLIDINYPRHDGCLGKLLTRCWIRAGDLVRDMDTLFSQHALSYTDEEIGGWGSVHLYVATRAEA
jgi:ubiquinone/menaquinone biosynthesis C-methylase UbiE